MSFTYPSCPLCSESMVLRTARKGRNPGNQFYVCSRFPRCKGTRPHSSQASTSARGAVQGAPDGFRENVHSATKPIEVSPAKPKVPLTEPQKKELVRLRDRLLNLSSRNRSIRLNRLDAKWTFDLSSLNTFGTQFANQLIESSLSFKSAPILPKPTKKSAEDHLRLAERLKHLHRAITEIQREKGLYDLYLGFPFLTGIPIGTETVLQAPLILIPVTLSESVPAKGARQWTINPSKDNPACFNRTLFFALSKICKLNINTILFEEDIPDELYGQTSFLQWVHATLNQYGIPCTLSPDAHDNVIDPVLEFSIKELPECFSPGKLEIQQNAVLGHFPQSNSSIQRDYEHFLELDQTELESITCFLAGGNLADTEGSTTSGTKDDSEIKQFEADDFEDSQEDSLETIDLRKEAENFFLLPSDSSQDRILLELSKPKVTGLVVWGPPGTGKSQTIVNIIGDCLAKNKTVLLVSQKRAALDVVYDRLGLKNLSSLVGLVHDAKLDRKTLYEKLAKETAKSSALGIGETKATVDPSAEIDRVAQTLKDAYTAYNDSASGLRLGEMYRKLGSKQAGTIKIASHWKRSGYATIQETALQLNSLQVQLGEEIDLPLLRERPSYAKLGYENREAFLTLLEEVINGVRYLEAASIVAISSDRTETGALENSTTEALRSLKMALVARTDAWRWLSWGFHRDKRQFKRIATEAKTYLEKCAKQFRHLAHQFLSQSVAAELAAGISAGENSLANLRVLSKFLDLKFNSFKSFDSTRETLAKEVQEIVQNIQSTENSGAIRKGDSWGAVFEAEVLCAMARDLEAKHPVISTIRSGQIDVLRGRYKDLLDQKVQFNIQFLRSKATGFMTFQDGRDFSRELNSDVSKKTRTFSIRKLNEKHLNKEFYRSILPVWLVSPEVVSDVFPPTRGLFDVVIFDEASQCTVEHGLPAVYRGKQVIIAGDEKQLPPNRMFETQMDNEEPSEDEETNATDEPSLLTLAKKTLRYKSHMLEWHYRSRHQELVTFSNEVFYHGRMKVAPNVIPFRKGNAPAISWHSVSGFWEERQNRAESDKVIDLIRNYLSSENPLSVGVITFNLPQKELILDRIDELQVSDPEFGALLAENKKLPIDQQLFVKNIENVQGDEREAIIFSVAYAPSHPGGRVNQMFGSLNMKGGENRLNVAITRAIKHVDIVASINPETDLSVSTLKSVGPKVLKNYLCFARAVALGDIERVNAILNEINPNLQLRGVESNITESPFETEVLEALEAAGFRVDTQVGQSGFRIDMAIVHPEDPSRYLLGIECDGAMFHSGVSVRERDVFRQRFLEDRGWKIHRIWSTNWWQHKEQEVAKVRQLIDSLLVQQRPAE